MRKQPAAQPSSPAKQPVAAAVAPRQDIQTPHARTWADQRPEAAQLKRMRDMIMMAGAAHQPAGPVVQRLTIEKNPTNGVFYSVSNSRNVITGLETPNHALYAADDQKGAVVEAMNQSMINSPWKVKEQSKTMTFKERDYTALNVEMKDDLADVYQNKVAPKYKEYRKAKRHAAQQEITDTLTNVDTSFRLDDTLACMTTVSAHLNLFKTLFQLGFQEPKQELKPAPKPALKPATPSPEPAPTAAADPRKIETTIVGIVRNLEEAFYHEAIQKDKMLDVAKTATSHINKLPHFALTQTEHLPLDHILKAIPDLLSKLAESLPKDLVVNMLTLHRYAFQTEALTNLDQDNLALYRSCDVTLSTIMGNEYDFTDEATEGQQKLYGLSNGKYHHAARIYADQEGDWVSLESFAAEGYIKQITGDSIPQTLDHSWQFLLYGTLKNPGATPTEVNEVAEVAEVDQTAHADVQPTTEMAAPPTDVHKEDEAFANFTRKRYRFMGYHQTGEMVKEIEQHKNKTVNADTVFGPFVPRKTAKRYFKKFQQQGVITADNKVTVPVDEDLVRQIIGKPHAHNTIQHLKKLQDKHHATVQPPEYSNIKQIAAWAAYLINPDDALKIVQQAKKEWKDTDMPIQTFNKKYWEIIKKIAATGELPNLAPETAPTAPIAPTPRPKQRNRFNPFRRKKKKP